MGSCALSRIPNTLELHTRARGQDLRPPTPRHGWFRSLRAAREAQDGPQGLSTV